jgi:predicted aspartyl protease
VDTGAELSWIPGDVLESLGIERYTVWRFRQANGSVLERWTGAAFVYVAGKRAADDVVFGEPGDLILLGARSLEGLNLRVDPARKRLVDAGPAPAAPSGVGILRLPATLIPPGAPHSDPGATLGAPESTPPSRRRPAT